MTCSPERYPDHGNDYELVAGNSTVNKIVLSNGSFEISTANLVSQPAPLGRMPASLRVNLIVPLMPA